MLELSQRIPFGPASRPGDTAPWPVADPTAFDLPWLRDQFAPQQQKRLTTVITAINDANKRIEAERAKGTRPVETGLGTKQPNGNVVLSGDDLELARSIRTHAERQTVAAMGEIRRSLDAVVPPVLRDMLRAAATVESLSERVFSKIACLARSLPSGMKMAELAQLKAAYTTMLQHVSPVELHRVAQACIDDASGNSLPLLDVCRVINFGRPKDDRAFLNATLITLAQVPEFDQATPLLQSVIDANNTAQLAWAGFTREARMATLKVGRGLAKGQARTFPSDPYRDLA